MTAGVLCSVYLLSTRNDFSVSELPADSVPAKIEYGKLEQEIFADMANEKFLKEKLYPAISQQFGHQFETSQLKKWFLEGQSKEITIKSGLIAFVKVKCYLSLHSQINEDVLIQGLNNEYGSLLPDELVELMCLAIEEQLNEGERNE